MTFKTEARVSVKDDATKELKKINKEFDKLSKNSRKTGSRSLFKGLSSSLSRASAKFGRSLRTVASRGFRGIGNVFQRGARGAVSILRAGISGAFSAARTVFLSAFTAAIAGPLAAIKSATERQDNINKQARDTNFSIEGLQFLKRFAQFNMQNPDSLDQALSAFNKRRSVLQREVGQEGFDEKGGSFFKNLSIAAQKQIAAAKTTEEAFFLFRSAVKDELGSDATRIAETLDMAMSDAGKKIVKIFTASNKEIADSNRDASARGFIFTQEQADAASKFRGAITGLKEVFIAASDQFSTKVVPQFTQSINSIADAIVRNRDVITDRASEIFKNVIDTLTSFFTKLSDGKFNSQLSSVVEGIGSVSRAFVSLSNGINALSNAFQTLDSLLAPLYSIMGVKRPLPDDLYGSTGHNLQGSGGLSSIQLRDKAIASAKARYDAIAADAVKKNGQANLDSGFKIREGSGNAVQGLNELAAALSQASANARNFKMPTQGPQPNGRGIRKAGTDRPASYNGALPGAGF